MALFKPRILYEDDHLLAVDKPADMASVPAPSAPESKTLQGKVRAWAKETGKDFKPYLLNRLDRQTSGIVLFGKFPRDREALETIPRAPTTQKIYLALVRGVPQPRKGTIRFPLEGRTTQKKLPAVTHYEVREIYEKTSLVEARIETGRQHQIRKHFAKIGCPLVLDKLYGDWNFNRRVQQAHKGSARMVLHAWKLEFIHPFTQAPVKVEAKFKR